VPTDETLHSVTLSQGERVVRVFPVIKHHHAIMAVREKPRVGRLWPQDEGISVIGQTVLPSPVAHGPGTPAALRGE
jgi:hypothetical protein